MIKYWLITSVPYGAEDQGVFPGDVIYTDNQNPNDLEGLCAEEISKIEYNKRWKQLTNEPHYIAALNREYND